MASCWQIVLYAAGCGLLIANAGSFENDDGIHDHGGAVSPFFTEGVQTMPFVAPGQAITPTGFSLGGTPIGAGSVAGTSLPTYHTSEGAYFSIGNSLRQGVNDTTFTQAGVGGWLNDTIESNGYNIQQEIQTVLSDGVMTESEMLLLQFDMDQYSLQVTMCTNMLASMKSAIQSVVSNIR